MSSCVTGVCLWLNFDLRSCDLAETDGTFVFVFFLGLSLKKPAKKKRKRKK